jgi:uncharacterized protein (DUF305 family)
MRRSRLLLVAAAVAAEFLCGHAIKDVAAADPRSEIASQQPSFDQLLSEAVARMHREMMVSPSGDPDRYFARMMIPHHAGAIEMAKAELIYGRNQVLRRLAESIVVEQNQEIEVMRRALAEMSSTYNASSGATDKQPHQLSHGRTLEQGR